jgi:hypothetical protein
MILPRRRSIERGRHALHSGMDVKAYAESVGRERATVHDEVYAAKVAEVVPDVRNDISGFFSQLVAIHSAPEWLWSALVNAMVKGDWTAEHECEVPMPFRLNEEDAQ